MQALLMQGSSRFCFHIAGRIGRWFTWNRECHAVMCLRLRRRAGHDWRERADVSAHGAGAIFLQDNTTVCRAVKCHEGDVAQASLW